MTRKVAGQARASAGPAGLALLLSLSLGGALAPAGAQPLPSSDASLLLVSSLDTSRAPSQAAWVVLEASDATWRLEGSGAWSGFERGQVIAPGTEIETGPSGSVTLVLGGDQLVVAPSSRLVVPLTGADSGQRLRHERGRVRVHVEPRPGGRDFEVKTPLLSLGIKGTDFEVSVEHGQDSVVVLKGHVQVTTPNEPAPIELSPGQGLRQSAAPEAHPERFGLAEPPTAEDLRPGSAWHLPAITDAVQANRLEMLDRPAATPEPSRVDGRRVTPDRQDAAGGRAATHDPRWPLVAIGVGACLLILALAMTLVQHLRRAWRNRPGPRGRRRRALTRGS